MAENRPIGQKYTNNFHCKTLQNLPQKNFCFQNMPSGNPGAPASQKILEKKKLSEWPMQSGWLGRDVRESSQKVIQKTKSTLTIRICTVNLIFLDKQHYFELHCFKGWQKVLCDCVCFH
jgi:hypothetical protein